MAHSSVPTLIRHIHSILWISFLIICHTNYALSQYNNFDKVTVRINGPNDTNLRGRVEVSSNGGVTWDLIYTTYYDWEIASVICRELQLGPPVIAKGSNVVSVDAGTRFIDTSSIPCIGTEKSLSDCSTRVRYETYNYPYTYLDVECLSPDAQEYDVAIIRKYESQNGIMLAFIDGRWGPICSDLIEYGTVDDTVCYQLGLQSSTSLPSTLGVSVYSDPVLSYIYCYGHESSISGCSSTKMFRTSCTNGAGFVEVSCRSRSSYSDDDASAGVGAVIVVLFVITMCVLFVCCVCCRQKRRRNQAPLPMTNMNTGTVPPKILTVHAPPPAYTDVVPPQGQGYPHPPPAPGYAPAPPTGYPAPVGSYPSKGGHSYPPNPTAGYAPPPPGPGYPPADVSSYPPAGGGPGYPPAAGPGYPPAAGPGYPPAAGPGYPSAAGPGYPPNTGPDLPPGTGPGYPTAPGYPPSTDSGYPQAPGPAVPGYPPESGAGPPSGITPSAPPAQNP